MTHNEYHRDYQREYRKNHPEKVKQYKDTYKKKHPKIGAKKYADSVGVGHYRIDLHPSTAGDNYLDVAS